MGEVKNYNHCPVIFTDEILSERSRRNVWKIGKRAIGYNTRDRILNLRSRAVWKRSENLLEGCRIYVEEGRIGKNGLRGIGGKCGCEIPSLRERVILSEVFCRCHELRNSKTGVPSGRRTVLPQVCFEQGNSGV